MTNMEHVPVRDEQTWDDLLDAAEDFLDEVERNLDVGEWVERLPVVDRDRPQSAPNGAQLQRLGELLRRGSDLEGVIAERQRSLRADMVATRQADRAGRAYLTTIP